MATKSNKEEFIIKAQTIYGIEHYDYSKVDYINNKTKVNIICLKHNTTFSMRPDIHIHCKQGCPKCGYEMNGNNRKFTNKEFLEKAFETHQDKYDYSLVEYKGTDIKVQIICPEHGIFEQRPHGHLKGQGCRKCYDSEHSKRNMKPLEQFISEANEVHNNKYDYSKTEYNGNKQRLIVICPIHGEFTTKPHLHLYQNCGCRKCTMSLGEERIFKYLSDNGIIHITEYKFPECKYINPLPFDFYLPNFNICIEYDGKQHFEKNIFYNDLEKQQDKDTIKTEYCKYNNIKLIRIPYTEYNNINSILEANLPKECYLQTDPISFASNRRIVSYLEAKEILKSEYPELKTGAKYKEWKKIIGNDKRLPANPPVTYTYREEWVSWTDFLSKDSIS